jgi:hypothetical protein
VQDCGGGSTVAPKKTNKKEEDKVVTNRPTASPGANPAMTTPATPTTAAPAASKGVVEPLCIIFLGGQACYDAVTKDLFTFQ